MSEKLDELLEELKEEGFWGKIEISYEAGKPQRAKKEESIKLCQTG